MEDCAAAAEFEECQTRAEDSGSKLQENGEAMAASDADSEIGNGPVLAEEVPSGIEVSLERLLQRQRR